MNAPQLVMSPSDVTRALEGIKSLGSPAVLPARLLGLGADDPPVPSWSWVVIAFGAGALVGAAYWPKVRDFLADRGIGR